MAATVFFTVLSGVLTYIAGQLLLKLVIEPVHEMRRTIGEISHTLIERANVIGNPGVPSGEVMNAASEELRKHSAKLNAHLYLIPSYDATAWVFRLPKRQQVLDASGNLIGLSNSIFRNNDRVHRTNAKRVETVCDSLGIYMKPEDRWPEGLD